MRIATFLFLLAAVASRPTEAQNLIPGASFDTSGDFTANWFNLSPSTTWSSEDLDASPTSGSARISNELAPATGVLVQSTCASVVPGATYAFSGWQFTPDLQIAEGVASISAQFRANCPAGAFVGGDVTEQSSAIGSWTLIEGEFAAPASAAGVRLLLVGIKTAGLPTDPFVVHFDEVFLPEPRALRSGVAALVAVALLQAPMRRASGRS